MLKIFRRLFLGLVVLVGSTGVTPTSVSSASPSGAPMAGASVLFTYIQAAEPSAAHNEAIVLYNAGSEAAIITNWCLSSKAMPEFACFIPNSDTEVVSIASNAYATIVSRQYAEAHAVQGEVPRTYTLIFEAAPGKSGSLVGSTDTLKLIDASKSSVAEYSWTGGVSTKAWLRDGLTPAASWVAVAILNSLPAVMPDSDEVEETWDEEDYNSEPEPTLHPVITEILPNPEGADTGNEFIELYNPGGEAFMNLGGYLFYVGNKAYAFPEDTPLLAPGEYRAFYNSEIRFTLPNTNGSVQLAYKGVLVGSPIVYAVPASGAAWAYGSGGWAYTKAPTPGDINEFPVLNESAIVGSTLTPCLVHQERNPATNRCRNKEGAMVAPTPCKAGQERNPETGRCRTIPSAKSPALCKEGQERNPATNRCKTIAVMTKAPHGIIKVTSEDVDGPAWYAWAAMGGVVLAVMGYGIWEWRSEVARGIAWLRARALWPRRTRHSKR